MSAAQTSTAGRAAQFTLSELTIGNSSMANGKTRLILGTVTGRGKSYRFCVGQTQWSDGQETRPPSVSFRTIGGKPINTRNALSAQREFVLSSDYVRAALVAAKTGGRMMACTRPNKRLHEMTPAERSAIGDEKVGHVRAKAGSMIDDLQRPISFKGCNAWNEIFMIVVQHDAGPNSITVSHNGDVASAWRLPLRFTRSSKKGMPIVEIRRAAIPLSLPDPGFLLIKVPGWLASKQAMCQAQSPTLCKSVDWTEAQLAAWESLRKDFFSIRNAKEKSARKSYLQGRYDRERAERNAAGYFTANDLAFGRSKL